MSATRNAIKAYIRSQKGGWWVERNDDVETKFFGPYENSWQAHNVAKQMRERGFKARAFQKKTGKK